MDHVSPPPTPTSTTGHFFSKTKASIRSSTQRALHKRESVSQLVSLKSHSKVSVQLESDRHPPEEQSGGHRTIHRARANSASSPSSPVFEGEDASFPRPVKLKFPYRQPVKEQSSLSPVSLGGIFGLTLVETLAPVIDSKRSLPTPPDDTAAMEPSSRSVDVSEAVVSYGPGYGVSAGIYRSNGNTTALGGNMQNPAMVYQHIHELSAKRVSTLDYLRKA